MKKYYRLLASCAILLLLKGLHTIYSRYPNEHNLVSTCRNQVAFEHKILLATLLTDGPNYTYSAIKLLKSVIKASDTIKFDKLVLELTNKPLAADLKAKLMQVGWKICQVDRIAPRDEENTYPRFRDQFTKLHLWNMTEYDAVLYMDSDAFVVGKIDELLNVHTHLNSQNHRIAGASDIWQGTWLNKFNMGIFSIKPNGTELRRLLELKKDPTLYFDPRMSEQEFLNVVYQNQWYNFGFANNANLLAFKEVRDYWYKHNNTINVIHYTVNKPWECEEYYKEVCDLWRNFE